MTKITYLELKMLVLLWHNHAVEFDRLTEELSINESYVRTTAKRLKARGVPIVNNCRVLFIDDEFKGVPRLSSGIAVEKIPASTVLTPAEYDLISYIWDDIHKTGDIAESTFCDEDHVRTLIYKLRNKGINIINEHAVGYFIAPEFKEKHDLQFCRVVEKVGE